MRTLLHGGRVYSPWSPEASSLLIEDGVVAWLGDDAAAATMSADKRIALGGSLVVPAFVDAHVHLTATGQLLTGLDLTPATSRRAVLDAVQARAQSGRGRPILGFGWDDSSWPEAGAPTAAEVDRAGFGGSVYLLRTDAHSAVASSALMASVPGLAAMPGYSPTGLLTRDAHHAVRQAAMSSLTPGDRRGLQQIALTAAAAQGIAAVHEMGGPEIAGAEDMAQALQLAGAKTMPAVYGYWGELHAVDTAIGLGAVGAGGDLFCDGSLGSHTAGLTQPYADAETSGYLRFAVEELAEHIAACTKAGLQAGFHAIGDAAINQVVEAMRQADEQLGGSGRVRSAGHRIEHAEMITEPAALASVGLIASMQPAFDATWGGGDGMYAHRLGAQRAQGLNPFAALAAAGVPLAFGSDSPVTPFSPWAAVRAAVHPSNPSHAITARASFAAHTRGGWRAARAEGTGAGVLSPGAPATYAIFDAGELAVDTPNETLARWSTDERAGVPGLPDLTPGAPLPRCLATVLAGSILFDSGELL